MFYFSFLECTPQQIEAVNPFRFVTVSFIIKTSYGNQAIYLIIQNDTKPVLTPARLKAVQLKNSSMNDWRHSGD